RADGYIVTLFDYGQDNGPGEFTCRFGTVEMPAECVAVKQNLLLLRVKEAKTIPMPWQEKDAIPAFGSRVHVPLVNPAGTTWMGTLKDGRKPPDGVEGRATAGLILDPRCEEAVVLEMDPNGPAKKAGLQIGNTIVRVGLDLVKRHNTDPDDR